ncbi:ABC transporter substrate-binding protein [Brevundimonas sp.]|jgi:iron(III) transport system substrate-binding protein|uniref:ABC transporter substrate-binding protein n=1 Tax=Brevundimonas sp. TaxID=1871086 RepID=UPI0037BFE4F4
MSGAFWLALLGVVTSLVLAGCGEEPDGPATAPRTRWAAGREGALTIYTNTSLMGPVLEAFNRRYPEIHIRLEDMNSTRMADRVVAEAGGPGADLVWSSAMDVQIKLINDGYAQTYRSPHRAALPDGSIWRDQGFGLTAEPVVFAYNRRLLPPELTPRSHAELIDLFEKHGEVFRGRTTIYDAERSGVALMQLSSDVQIYPDAWRLVEALGRTRPRLDTSGQRMMGQLADGRVLFAYNMNQSYGETWAARDPDIGLVTPTDYHLSVSRVAFIPRNAAHPNAARLFLDFLLSREGQRAIARIGVRPVRDDVEATERPVVAGVHVVRVGPALLANLDRMRRDHLLTRWNQAMAGSPRAPLDPNAP